MYTAETYRAIIVEKIPKDAILPQHDEEGHWYKRPHKEYKYPSVNGKIGILKEGHGLQDWKMNLALDFVFKNLSTITPENAMDMRDSAANASTLVLEDAGDIGTDVHDYREHIFRDWIRNGFRPKDFISYIPEDQKDIRAVSAIGALAKFCDDYHYEPIATELFVYSDKMELGGTLDDIGFIKLPVLPIVNYKCKHNVMGNECFDCGQRFKKYLVLLDLKTSNSLKESYWIQVALYFEMFYKLTKIRPQKAFILKLDKHNRSYKVEFIREVPRIVRLAKKIVEVANGMEEVVELRKKEFVMV